MMNRVALLILFTLLAFSCKEEKTEPKSTLAEMLERFLLDNNQTVIPTDLNYLDYSYGARIDSDKNVICNVSFELNDFNLLDDLNNILQDYGYNRLDFSQHLEFLETTNGRTMSCINRWHFYLFDDGSAMVTTCSNCHGPYECMTTWQ